MTDQDRIAALEAEVERLKDNLEAERAANVLFVAQVTTLTEQRDLAAAEAERMRTMLAAARPYLDTDHSSDGDHCSSCRRVEAFDAALAAPSTAAQVLSERDERVAGLAAGRERALVYRELREGALDGQLIERDERVRRKALEAAARLFDSDDAASANAWIARAIRARAEVKP